MKPVQSNPGGGPLGDVVRFLVAACLLVIAASTPWMGFAAAEYYENRKFFVILEGDWFFAFAIVAGLACGWLAVTMLSGIRKRKV